MVGIPQGLDVGQLKNGGKGHGFADQIDDVAFAPAQGFDGDGDAVILSVALGGIYSGCLGVANFFIMGMMVQSVTERMAEKERTEQEIADMSIQMQNRMKISYNMRMIGLFGLLVLGIAVFKFDALATILPSVFPSIVIRVLQIMEARKAPVSEGSEEP